MSEVDGPDDDGFVRVEVVRRAHALGQAAPDVPALLVRRVPPEEAGEDIHTSKTRDAASSQTPDVVQGRRYAGALAFVRKRPGGAFPGVVTIGRARGVDVCVALSRVSKVHAYLLPEGEGWVVVDQRSRNGTFVQGRRIAPGERAPLHDGDELRLGDVFALEFVAPGRLVARLASSHSPGRAVDSPPA